MDIGTDLDYDMHNTSNTNITIPATKGVKEAAYIWLLLLILPLFTVFGNLLVVFSITRFQNLRSVTNHMILSLAIADMLIGLFVMPLSISNMILSHYWPYGSAMCHLWHSIDVLASTASILNLCIISLDRYWAVIAPLHYPRLMSEKRGLICISMVWICSAGISFPMIALWDYVDLWVEGKCSFTNNSAYLIISSMVSFYIPVMLMTIVYLKIFLAIRSQSKDYSHNPTYGISGGGGIRLRVHRGGTVQRKESETQKISSTDYNHNSEQAETDAFLSKTSHRTSNTSHMQKLLKRFHSTSVAKTSVSKAPGNERRVARTLAIVLGVFLVFWFPFFICNLIAAACEHCLSDAFIFDFVTWLGHVNSGINPVIYALSMKNMRLAFISVIQCRCKNYEISHRRPKHSSSTGVRHRDDVTMVVNR